MHLAKSEGHEENTEYHKQGGELSGVGRRGTAQTLWIVTLSISGTVTKRMASGLHTTVSLYSRADSAFLVKFLNFFLASALSSASKYQTVIAYLVA